MNNYINIVLTAKDVMSRRVTTLEAGTTADEAARLLARKGVSGAPVVDRRGGLLGVLSQADLARPRATREEKIPAYYRDGETLRPARLFLHEAGARVEDLMTPAVLSADEQTPVPELAAFMLARRVHRVMITRRGLLAGIVSSMDLVRLVAQVPARGTRRPRRRAGPRRVRRGGAHVQEPC